VLVRLMPAAEKRISPIYIPLQQAMQDLLSQYSDEQLTFLHEFMSKSGRIMADEIARQRTKPPAKN
jgi:hypothetical protein